MALFQFYRCGLQLGAYGASNCGFGNSCYIIELHGL